MASLRLGPAFPLRLYVILTLVLGLLPSGWLVFAEALTFTVVPRQVVEYRLGRHKRHNQQRELTLKQIFIDAGCEGQHLSE